MSPVRLPRLEAILGGPLDDTLDVLTIERLVQEQVAESDQWDFKQSSYGTSEDDKAELANDVCAFANGIGGALICGVADVKGVASKTMSFPVSDADRRHVMSVVAARTAPMVSVETILVANDQGDGFLLIVVPASVDAPHAVIGAKQTGLVFPIRHGSATRYLHEPELADRYRNRFTQAGAQVARLDKVGQEGRAALSPDDPWLSLAVVPNSGGSQALTVNTARENRTWLEQALRRSPWGRALFDSRTAEVGVARTIHTYRSERDGYAHSSYAELHADGASYAAVQLPQRFGRQPEGQEPTQTSIGDSELVDVTVALVDLSAGHARRCGVTGDGVAELSVMQPGGDGTFPLPMALTNNRHHGMTMNSTERRLSMVPPSRHTVDLSGTAADTTTALLTARVLANTIVQAFGQAEVFHIDSDGGLRARFFGDGATRARKWAVEHGVIVNEEGGVS